MKYAEMKKSHMQGADTVRRFLYRLGATDIRKTNKPGCDFEFSFGPGHAVATVRTVVNEKNTNNVFSETYVTRMTANSDGRDMTQYLGNTYICPANFIFFLNGSKLCIVPARKFRNWVDRNAQTFQTSMEIYWWNKQEIRRHGLLIPLERIRTEFAKGNRNVSIYQLKIDPENKDNIDFIQEF